MFSHWVAYLSPLGAGQTPDVLARGYLGGPWLRGIQVSGVNMEPKEGHRAGSSGKGRRECWELAAVLRPGHSCGDGKGGALFGKMTLAHVEGHLSIITDS